MGGYLYSRHMMVMTGLSLLCWSAYDRTEYDVCGHSLIDEEKR